MPTDISERIKGAMPMTTETSRIQAPYDPNRLLDTLQSLLNLENDLALSKALGLPDTVISQIRHRGYPVAPSNLIRMHELSRLSVSELREIEGNRRRTVRTEYDSVSCNDAGEHSGERSVSSFSYLCVATVFVCLLFYIIP